jgi:nucleotide-binding universal stress UspA family protein
MRIKKILCPTDLSQNSAKGIEYAFFLSHDYGAEIVILHVTAFPSVPLAAAYPMDPLPSERRFYAPPSVDQILRRARTRLDAFVKSLPNSRFQTRVTLGKPAQEIINAAFQEHTDLIVMAKRRLGTLRRLLSPSISEHVSRQAPCPVLSICPQQIQSTIPRSRSAVTGLFLGAEA